ncbi:CDP-glycerol glycerophosphotransferase family protein [Leucobacter sp. USHLN153]|uniref:CDP-glycerol glycerophosphotransferase family protein n=1 Tax=Leucobacter sp. USHLN153 TaxID=3081268 RepID=UPI003015F799
MLMMKRAVPLAQQLIVMLLAGAALILAQAGFTTPGIATWGVGYLWCILLALPDRRARARAVGLVTRALLVVATLLLASRFAPSDPLFLYCAVLLALLLFAAEQMLARLPTTLLARSSHLNGTDAPAALPRLKKASAVACDLLPPSLLIPSLLHASSSYSLLFCLAVGIVLGLAWLQHILSIRNDRRDFSSLPARMEAAGPVFLMHWDAPGESRYQLDMWLPHLADLQIPFVVLVRNPEAFRSAVMAAGPTPVVLAPRHTDVERLLVPSVRAVLYVNNADQNNQILRFEGLTHIMLSHGDSQKTTSSTRIFRLFDRIYLAGQAGIDRFKQSGVDIPSERFAIVGRPQVRGIKQDLTPISEKSTPTVLYAPTWMGDFKDSSYTSLLYARGLIELLLERNCTVIFRPHPFTDRHHETAQAAADLRELLRRDQEDHGRGHLYGSVPETEMTLHDCFNRSDAMLADISAVVADYLYSGKPLGVFVDDPQLRDSTESEGRYRFGRDPSEWTEQLDRLLVEDPLRDRRREATRYYLGNADVEPPDTLFADVALADIVGSSLMSGHNEPGDDLR